MISRAEEYRARAIACEESAKEVSDLVMKRQFEELAAQWHYMANQAARYGWGATAESQDDEGRQP